jgi:hypothetical protein
MKPLPYWGGCALARTCPGRGTRDEREAETQARQESGLVVHMKRQTKQIIQVILVILAILQLGYASEEYLAGTNGWTFTLAGGTSFLILAGLLGSRS